MKVLQKSVGKTDGSGGDQRPKGVESLRRVSVNRKYFLDKQWGAKEGILSPLPRGLLDTYTRPPPSQVFRIKSGSMPIKIRLDSFSNTTQKQLKAQVLAGKKLAE